MGKAGYLGLVSRTPLEEASNQLLRTQALPQLGYLLVESNPPMEPRGIARKVIGGTTLLPGAGPIAALKSCKNCRQAETMLAFEACSRAGTVGNEPPR